MAHETSRHTNPDRPVELAQRELHVIFGAGQIGTRLAEEILARGHQVRMIRRGQPGRPIPGLEWRRADITDAVRLLQAEAPGQRSASRAVAAHAGRSNGTIERPFLACSQLRSRSAAGRKGRKWRGGPLGSPQGGATQFAACRGHASGASSVLTRRGLSPSESHAAESACGFRRGRFHRRRRMP